MRQVILETCGSRKRAALIKEQIPIGFFQEPLDLIEPMGELVVARALHYIPSLGLFVSLPSGKKGLLPDQEWPTKEIDPRPLNDLKAGDVLLLQVKRAAVPNKHAVMTRNIQIVGEALIFLPYGNYVAISKQIEPEKAAQLRADVSSVLMHHEGVIVRSKAFDCSDRQLHNELAELRIQWNGLLNKARSLSSVNVIQTVSFSDRLTALLPSLMEREWWTNDKEAFERLKSKGERVYFKEEAALFESYGLNREWERAHKPLVKLESGLSLIFEKTEALTAIDVNTGSYIGNESKGQTAFEGNLEVLPELVRQIGLRQLSGMILIDFLKMDNSDHQRLIADQLTTLLKEDMVSSFVAGFTKLGLLEMTRKDIGLSPEI